MSKPIPLECPRCLMANPNAAQYCECGYDFTPHFQGFPLKPAFGSAPRKRLFSEEMGRGSFLLGILLIWLALSVGELYRIRIELPRRPKMELGLSSLMVGMTDLAAALVVGAIGWACVWIVLAAQSKRDGSLCPTNERWWPYPKVTRSRSVREVCMLTQGFGRATSERPIQDQTMGS